MKSVKAKVEYCLLNFPETRNSDKKLLTTVWRQFYYAYLEEVDKSDNPVDELCGLIIEKLPSPESIRRVRQKLQEKGKYRADEKVREVRMTKARVVQDGVMGRNKGAWGDLLS